MEKSNEQYSACLSGEMNLQWVDCLFRKEVLLRAEEKPLEWIMDLASRSYTVEELASNSCADTSATANACLRLPEQR